jgi:hypothetical protein
MGASNSKQHSEMSHAQVFAHMIIGLNGPSTTEFATKIRAASKLPNSKLASLYSPKQLQLIEILYLYMQGVYYT